MADQAHEPLKQWLECENFSTAMKLINAIPMFHGNLIQLEFFVRQMDAAYAMIEGFTLSDNIRKILGFQFFNRFGPEILKSAYIKSSMSWPEARIKLCNKYGGFQCPLKRYASIIVNLEREGSESSVEFAQRLNVEMRLLKWRISEEIDDKTEASLRYTIYEELALENLRHQIPDFRVLITAKNIVDAIQLLKKEEKFIEKNRASLEPQHRNNKQRYYR